MSTLPVVAKEGGLVEGQTLTEDQTLSVDVCIVGSGAGGAVAANLLAQAGFRVIVLEEGGYFTSERFTMREDEAYPNLYQEGAQRATKDLSVSVFQGRAVGGTTVVNWTTCFRTPKQTLQLWEERHGVVGLNEKALNPHWEVIEKRLNIHQGGPESVNRNNQLLWDGCESLGYQVDRLYRNVVGCAHTGFCGMGCPVDSKQSMLLTYLPDAMKAGASVVSRCRVVKLEHSGAKVTAARARFLDGFGREETGVSLTVRARHFVTSGGAINTPALLLRSEAPDPHRRLGKRTFLHPVVVSGGEYETPVDGFSGAPQTVACHQFAQRGEAVGYFLEAAPVYPLLMATSIPGFGLAHREKLSRLRHFAAHIAIAIDGHHEEDEGGTVKLRPSGAPELHYTPAPKVYQAFREAQKVMAEIQLESGAQRVLTFHNQSVELRSKRDLHKLDRAEFSPNRVAVFSAHQMGGAMMSEDPRRGVVRSSDLGHHQLANLSVIDGSVFPTSLGVNPQLSIYGLAHKMAGQLAEAL